MATPKPKSITFLGDSRDRLSAFPPIVKARVGFELYAVQTGRDPSDWRPMKTIGPAVKEIRVRDESGAYRVIYLAALADRVLVLHAFQKKSQKTLQRDIELATKRLKEWKAMNDGS